MAISQGMGNPKGSGIGRGVFSAPKNMAKVPKKGSELRLNSPLQGSDAMKVRDMASRRMREESSRGMPA